MMTMTMLVPLQTMLTTTMKTTTRKRKKRKRLKMNTEFRFM